MNTRGREKIKKIVKSVKEENKKGIFIASNNTNYLKKIGVKGNYVNIEDKYNSFIEQYICSKSKKFYYLNLENSRYGKSDNRSTWTSFVIDYRNYFNKLKNNINLHSQRNIEKNEDK